MSIARGGSNGAEVAASLGSSVLRLQRQPRWQAAMAAATRRREKRKLGFQWEGMIQAREWFGYSYGYGVVCTFAKGPKYISRNYK